MRKLHLWRPFLASIAQRCNGDFLLRDVFSELDACDITQQSNQLKMESSASPKKTSSGGGATATPAVNATTEEADILTEVSRQQHLQRQLQGARDQAALSQAEEVRKEELRRHARYVASPPAALHLSTAELIQEKAPQHFTPAENSSSKLSALPHLESPGTVAVVTLVGKVLSEAQMHGEEASTEGMNDSSVEENGPHAFFFVEYSVPFLPLSKPVTVQVRCYGVTLASFATRHVKMGDLVHVLGHVLPLDPSTSREPAFCVCALPVGGNISVVLSAECATAY
ncbi:hypothetical protein TraAM80_00082 [Trypanosoma rangeli]|uniref:Uncharacterized protein n=1 Tax=Trypanosoma rangeli TaxID=5698 RepID=A0A422P4T3_TRYRA|nr:uncharacterized protein TraAM80_00082 [Trypanosoma rangeli]RNF12730.1 hypothetical protein TraAM80_00082 [Trypanosoma rangeli]|eukprot:RNF12730.1 hypothetical protein TraAM80_00082 [Trypanosoma rangeli]